MGSRMPRIGRRIVRACDGRDSERTQRKREAGFPHERDTEDRTGIGENGAAGGDSAAVSLATARSSVT